MTIFTSKAISNIPGILQFLDNDAQQGEPCFIGWGMKPSGRRAKNLAEHRGAVPVFLEDGFLRSFGTGDLFPPLSLVVDRYGIYYDCTRPSTLENLLNSDIDLLDGIADDVARAHDLIIKHNLSKYNHAPPLDLAMLRPSDHRRILVVDQTVGDLSISLGGANADTFQQMLDAARIENPGATIYVKTHPEVTSGRKGGHYDALEGDEHTVILRHAINPLSLIHHMDRVYVVSSTMGFEALLAGKSVTCFGMPWYAGWGATDDRLACSRRTKHRSIEQLFAAAYFHYARYLNPTTGELGTIFDGIKWLVRQKETTRQIHGRESRGRLICIGFRRWKQANIAPLFSLLPNLVNFVPSSIAAHALSPRSGDTLLWWGNHPPAGVLELAERSGARTMRMEDGFIRSVGLGSDLIPPLSLVLDEQGIYFDPHTPSRLETILANNDCTLEEIEQARLVRQFVVEHGITKYNMETRKPADWRSEGRDVVLVPGQVEDDASIRFGCSTIKTNDALLAAVRNARPEAFIVYKPHPDVLSGNRRGKLALDQAEKWADHIETKLSVVSCIESSNEVHTMTSLTGFDALLRGKKVVTYGQPFYAGWGLTEDHDRNGMALQRRARKISLDELVAATLLRYPLYWDPVLKGYTNCLATIHRIATKLDTLEQSGDLRKLKPGYVRRQIRKARILTKAWLSQK